MAELWPNLKIILAELAVIFKKFGRILFQTVGNTEKFRFGTLCWAFKHNSRINTLTQSFKMVLKCFAFEITKSVWKLTCSLCKWQGWQFHGERKKALQLSWKPKNVENLKIHMYYLSWDESIVNNHTGEENSHKKMRWR